MRTAFIYSDRWADYDYGPLHPMRLFRLRLTQHLIRDYGLLDGALVVEPSPASVEELQAFHTPEYLAALRRGNSGGSFDGAWQYGLGPGDNPTFRGVYDLCSLIAGATLTAARLVASGEVDVAFNISGGLHHGLENRASGFCYTNDVVLAILGLRAQGLRVAYVDLDAHHGDGVQHAFYTTDQVLTISLHETGTFLFPGTGFEDEMGLEEGTGYSVNVPLHPYTDDDTYAWAFEQVVPPLLRAFQPDVVVTQLGCDTLHSDPLAHLELTTHGYERVLARLKELCPRWLACGGGGYDLGNVPRAWTLAWARMNGVELPDDLPPPYREEAERLGLWARSLRDPAPTAPVGSARREAERVVQFLREQVFPLVGA
jgi:acetoin utilization protein AcuC